MTTGGCSAEPCQVVQEDTKAYLVNPNAQGRTAPCTTMSIERRIRMMRSDVTQKLKRLVGRSVTDSKLFVAGFLQDGCQLHCGTEAGLNVVPHVVHNAVFRIGLSILVCEPPVPKLDAHL